MTTASSRGPALRGKGPGRGMTGSMGSFTVRRARLVLVVALLAVVGFGVVTLVMPATSWLQTEAAPSLYLMMVL